MSSEQASEPGGETHRARLREAVKRFLAATEGNEMIAAIKEFPELLSDAAERIAAQTAEILRDGNEPTLADEVDEQVQLLRRARQVGIEHALFEDMTAPFQAAMDTANATLSQYLLTGRAELLDEAVEGWRPIVAHEYLTFLGAATERWALRRTATALVHLFRRDGQVEPLDHAVALLDRAAGLPEADDTDPVGYLLELGAALALRYQARHDPADHDRAVVTFRAIVERSRPGLPAYRMATEALRTLKANDS